ncbi:MAG: hypothetical protein JWO50_631 [Candidatus Kaiserbacteria bacterium]|nr:hypothetical protein [Candidatus Kaiserbacteria bacterium]
METLYQLSYIGFFYSLRNCVVHHSRELCENTTKKLTFEVDRLHTAALVAAPPSILRAKGL